MPIDLPSANSDSPSPRSPLDAARAVTVFLVRGDRLAAVRRQVPSSEAVSLDAAAEGLLTPLTEAEQQQGLGSRIPPAVRELETAVGGGTVKVVLPPEVARLPVSEQIYALGQIVFTVLEGSGLASVTFTDVPGGRSRCRATRAGWSQARSPVTTTPGSPRPPKTTADRDRGPLTPASVHGAGASTGGASATSRSGRFAVSRTSTVATIDSTARPIK